MNTNLDFDKIGKCVEAYERHDGNEDMQNGFAFAMLKECYPNEESYDNAKRRFFATEGKTTQDVYGYFKKLYTDYQNPSSAVSAFVHNPQGVSNEKANEIIKSNEWLKFQKFSKRVSPEVRDAAFSIVYAEGTRSDIAEAWADKLLSMPEDKQNAVLWGAYVLSPEKSAIFVERVGTRVLENLGDNAFNISEYWEASQKGVNPHTVFDAVSQLDAIDENGKVKADKLEALNKRLNELRSENSMFNEESSQVYVEKFGNLFTGNGYNADTKEYSAEFIESEYTKGKRYKDVFNLVSQIRNIKKSNFGKQGAVAQTIEDATVVGVEILKYVGAAGLGTLISKNPIASISLVSAVMYSEFKPQMFNALRHDGNMSVEAANRYANFATTGMVAANYIGYTSWIKAVKPSSYLLGTEITKVNAREYFFHALKEMPKNFVRQGGTETISEYAESVVDYATKLWANDHADATFDEVELWENFCQDFKDTTRIMPTLMFGSTLLGGGLAINKVRSDSGVGWNFKKLIAPSDAINHTLQTHAAYAQAEAAAMEAAKKLGGTEQSIDFVQKYQHAKTDEEKTQLFKDTYSSEEERENARAILENVDKFDGEVQKAFANILADAAKANARETEELDRRAQDIAVFNDVKEDSDGAKKFTIVENLLDKLGAREDVVMINSASDLETLGFSPEKAQEIFSQVGKKGLYSAENDKVYMLPSHFKNGVDAFRTFAHERGHWIANKMKNTPEYRGMLLTILQLTGGEENLRSLLPTSYANDNASSLAEEYLMRVVERVAMEEVLNANQKGVWNFFKTKFKKWFGGENTFANVADKQIADIARDIYKRAVGEKPKLGNYWEAGTPENNSQKVSGMWEIVDASELITSTDHGYDDTLQPRNRNRQASTVQTSQIATYLDPARLDSDTTTDKGAPIIDARKMIISGNGRTLAIREAYGAENKERARAYREFVLRRAEELGIDVDANIKNPVLVRRVDNLGDMTLADFAARSNKSQVAAMSNAENAIADARRILDAHLLDIFFPSENGDVLAASNNDFITGFLEIIGNREEYVDKHGARKPNLAPRIKAAVLAATLNPEKRDIIEDLLDNPQGWSGLINGLLGSVANLAKLDGNADYDLANELSEAVEIYVGLARAGETVATFNAQEDFLRPQISEEVGFLIELFEKNSRTPTGVSGVLNEYYNLVKNIDTTSQDMFGVENPPKIDQLRQAYGRYATDLTNEEIKLRDTGSDNLDNDFKKQIAEVRAKYEKTSMWLKAPNGQPTKLTEAQWLAVRTPNFKRWFGDWETLAIINEVENLPAEAISKIEEKFTDKKTIESLFEKFGITKNEKSGNDVIFSKETIGKIIKHKSDVPLSAVVHEFKKLFEKSILFLEETETKKEGHKEHPNFKGYEHYVNKFSFGGKEYYIRFTVPVENSKKQTLKKGYIPRKVHSSYISDISIYKKSSQNDTSNTLGINGNSRFIDNKLADFLQSVNEKDVSKVVDENGEPLVVYHGTRSTKEFNEFKGTQHFFSDNPIVADGFLNGNDYVLEINGDSYPMSRRDLEFLADNIMGDSAEYDSLVGEYEAGEMSYANTLLSDITYNEYKEDAIVDFPFAIRKGGRIVEAFLNIKNPVEKDYGGKTWQAGKVMPEQDLWESREADGLIGRNIREGGLTGKLRNGEDFPLSTDYVVRNSNQIKSATDNIGTYSENPDIRWREVDTRSPEELEAINKQFTDLYEQYKNGDNGAYEKAVQLVAEEAKRKGYDVKVYHGTGADGFNIADATSKHEENGEGNQAHGQGLYMAVSRDTAEGYRFSAVNGRDYWEYWAKGRLLNNEHKKVGIYRATWVHIIAELREKGFLKIKKNFEKDIGKYSKDIDKYNERITHFREKAKRSRSKYYQYMGDVEYYADLKKRVINYKEEAEARLSLFERANDWLISEGISIDDIERKERGEGHLFDWFHNMKPEELLDEQKMNRDNPKLLKKLTNAFEEDVEPILDEEIKNGQILRVSKTDYYPDVIDGGDIIKMWGRLLGYKKLYEILLKHGIRGITYDGRQDGRCFVSFEGGATVKLQDPFTFDNEGKLIPLTERFDSSNPDLRWRDDGDISEESINEIIDRVYQSTSNKAKHYIKVLKKISDEEADFLLKETGIDLKGYSHALDNYGILHMQSEHTENAEREKARGQKPLELEDIRKISKVILGYDNVKAVGKTSVGRDAIRFEKNIGNELILVIDEVRTGKKLLVPVTMYIRKKRLTSNAEASSHTSETLSTSLNIQSQNNSGNQENNSRLKSLLRQERSENPVIWASIVLAKEILLGKPITSAKLEKVLPSDKFDGSKRNYAIERAKRIAEKTKLTQKEYSDNLNKAIQKAESDLFWQEEFVENAYRAFSKGGEEYGFAKQKLLQYLKDMRNKELAKVKGYETDDFDFDLISAIMQAQEAEPTKNEERKTKNEKLDEEELDISDGEFDGDKELSGKKMPLAPSPIRDVISSIRKEVAKRARNADSDTKTLNEKYRKTLVNILTDAAKELVYGKEREAIMKKISDLSRKGYAVIKIKDGERAGQKIDNYTLRAEHIALRIFNRGVRDTKTQLLETFDKIIKRKGKKPTRMERDDKRRISGAVQMRIYKIGKFAQMDAEELEKEFYSAIDKLNNVDAHFAGTNGNQVKEFVDIEDVRAEVVNTLADIQMFGNLREKTRGEMKHAVDFLENYIEEEMQKQKERVAKKKEEAEKKRKIIIDALKMSKHNAHKDGILRSGARGLLNKTMPFDSYLAMLGEYAIGETFKAFDTWLKELVAKIDRAIANVANETFQAQLALQRIVVECYGGNFSDALKRLLKPDAKYEEFSNLRGENDMDMKQPMALANVLQLYASATQENYQQNVYAHRAKKNPDVETLQKKIDEILLKFPDRTSKHGEEWEKAKEKIDAFEAEIKSLQKNATSDYVARLEKVLTPADKKFVELLRQQYADALPALSAVAKRVIGLPIEQADVLYMPVKIKRAKSFGESVGQVPVIPKVLSPRIPHLRDFDETANPISLFLDRVRENAQFKYFSEIYIELRSIFGNEELQDLISQRCGQNTLQGLLDFVADISSGKTRGFKDEWIQKANGLFAITALGFNLGSGVRQLLPGCFSWGTYIGTLTVLKNIATFFTPEGYAAAKEIWKSENGRRRFTIGNLQIMEEMLATPDQNKFWAFYKRHSLFFNRASDMIAISVVGQGVYRTGIESYLRQGFNIDKAREMAMADMWQIAERTQASGRIHNMAQWQRRGGDLGKAIGMFSAPPQLMFAKSLQDIRRAIALGVKTPEGRAAAWRAIKTWSTVSILVEGSYALSGVMWNAFLKGFFEEDDDERIFKQMATGPFGGLFLFGRIIEGAGNGHSSVIPIESFKRPIKSVYDIALDVATLDIEKAPEDLDKLAKSLFPFYRDGKKVWTEREIGEKLSEIFD